MLRVSDPTDEEGGDVKAKGDGKEGKKSCEMKKIARTERKRGVCLGLWDPSFASSSMIDLIHTLVFASSFMVDSSSV